MKCLHALVKSNLSPSPNEEHSCLPKPAFSINRDFLSIIPFEWWMKRGHTPRLNTIYDNRVFPPVLLITSFLEVQQAKERILYNRSKNAWWRSYGGMGKGSSKRLLEGGRMGGRWERTNPLTSKMRSDVPEVQKTPEKSLKQLSKPWEIRDNRQELDKIGGDESCFYINVRLTRQM